MFYQVSVWKSAVGGSTTDNGLRELQLQLATCTTGDGTGDEANTLDVVFETSGLGGLLLKYTSLEVGKCMGTPCFTFILDQKFHHVSGRTSISQDFLESIIWQSNNFAHSQNSQG